MIDEQQAAELVRSSLGISPAQVHRQTLTFSGNAVFKVDLNNTQSVVLRVSSRPKTFAYTGRNLDALRALGLPVQQVLATGPAPTGGSFIILNWLPGRDLMYELQLMTPAQMTRAAATITRWQQQVGTLPMSRGFGWAPIGKSAATARWTDIFGPSGNPPLAENTLPLDQLRHRLRQARKSIEPHFTTVQPVCFLDDLTTKNVLVENGELTGVIDIDFVCFGDPLMSIGTTLALLAVDVGDTGRFYGQQLLRFSNSTPVQMQAIHFYAALWMVGIINAAESAGDMARVQELMPIAEKIMRLAEPSSSATIRPAA